MVTSKFHTTGDTSYISRTIIDGSNPDHQDSASVVRFDSVQSFCACIKGFTIRKGSGTRTGSNSRGGGGIMCYNSSPTIANNIIIANKAKSDLGFGAGGGIYCNSNSSPKIINNIIKEDTAGAGGGISGGSSSMIVANNVIVQNKASYGYGGIDWACGIITNNTIDGNSGGGIYVSGMACQITNNIIANSDSGAGIVCGVNPQTISYNNVWNNSSGNFCSGYGNMTRTNRNGTPCDSFYNISQDPHFVMDGYHLDDSSACIDAGDNNAPSLPATDFEGNPRVVDGNQDDSFFVDMGAYEYQSGGFEGFGKIVGGGKDTENKSSGKIPDKFSLLQNYPNPFNPTTVVQFKITQPAKVSLKIYNILGQLVRVLVDEEKAAGTYTVYWDGNGKNGQPVSSGIYFYKLDAGDLTEVKKMVLTK